MKRGWFGPKAFGWGASPASWEGWAVTALFVLAMGGSAFIHPADGIGAWIARGLALAAYLAVVVLTYRSDTRTFL